MVAPLTAWIEHSAPVRRPSSRGLPARVRAQAGRGAEGDDLEDAAERLVRLALDVDVLDHRVARVAVQAAHGIVVDALEVLDAQRLVARRRPHRADLHHVRADLDPERAQEGLGQRAAGHPRGGLARAGALEHVAHVAQAVLPGADEVGVTGARQVDLGHLGLHRPRVHPLLPVGEVAVGDLQRDRPAERAPVAHPAGDLARDRARSSCARRARGRAGGAPCRGRSPRGRARGPRAGPRPRRSGRGRATRRP